MIDYTLSPAEICDVLNIAKSTLLRWERDHQIPAAVRDTSGERRYGSTHIQAIAEKVIKSRYDVAAKSDNAAALDELTEVSALCKFLEGSRLGLYELAERPRLSERTLKELLSRALQLHPSDEQFANIVEVLWSHVSRTRTPQTQAA